MLSFIFFEIAFSRDTGYLCSCGPLFVASGHIGQAEYNGRLWAILLPSIWDEHGKQTTLKQLCFIQNCKISEFL